MYYICPILHIFSALASAQCARPRRTTFAFEVAHLNLMIMS